LETADRGLATELVYGVLRHRARLDRALAAHARGGIRLSQPGIIALRVAAYELLVLGTPAHAVVDDAVGAVRAVLGARVADFPNPALRKLAAAGEPPPPTDLLERLAAVHSVPDWIARRLVAAVGAGEAEAAAAAMNQPAPLSVRVALWRAARDEVAAALGAA